MAGQPRNKDVVWEELRRKMPVADRWAYFDHAAVAPISGPAHEALKAYAEQSVRDGDTVWTGWAQAAEDLRRRAASLLGAAVEEIALVPNTTAGISLVAEGFPWRDGDNVVTLAGEFPSNLYPWINLADRGVSERRVEMDGVEVDLGRLADACDERTRIVAVSWVGYATGWRIDAAALAELVHQRGALLLLDAIQGMGVFPLNVAEAGVDFLAADGHKWMLGPEGAGLFYCRREHLDLLRPFGVGWHSVVNEQDFSHIELNIRPEAARYEGGTQNMPGMLALGASLDLLAQFGLAADRSPIADRVLDITDEICGRLEVFGAVVVSRREAGHCSGIVSFELPGRDPAEVRRHCLTAGVVLSCRAGRLRVSPHAYNNEEDIERLIESLE